MPSQDYCQRVKCGIIPQSSVSFEDLYACSAQYGAGALYPCHADCVQYGACVHPVNLPIPLLGPTAVVLEEMVPPLPTPPVLFNDVIPPVPEILQIPMVSTNPCDGWWEDLNRGIRENPVCAVAALIGSVLLLSQARK